MSGGNGFTPCQYRKLRLGAIVVRAAAIPLRVSTPPLAAIISLALAACATVEPPRPPEVRTQTVEVRVPVPVPCFTEAERPVLPPVTPINLETATVDQMAAAMAADDLAQELFARAVDNLFMKCLKGSP